MAELDASKNENKVLTEKANSCEKIKNDLISDARILDTTIIELKGEVSSKDQAVSGLKRDLD